MAPRPSPHPRAWRRHAARRRRPAGARPAFASATARRALLAVALPTLLLPASAHADAQVRFLNACPGDGAGTLDVIRGARSIETKAAAFGRLTGYVSAPAGRTRLRHGEEGDETLKLDAVLEDGRSYTVAAVGNPGSEVLRLFGEQTGRQDKALVRVVHLSPELGAPDLQVDGTTVVRGLPYLGQTSYTPLAPGKHTLSAMNPRQHSTVLSADVRLRRGTVSTAYVLGGSGEPARAVLTRDASASSSASGARSTSRPRRGQAVHVVRSGESLWAIAQRWVDARATDAQIWDEVLRLWRLNADRIPSGDPDLILPGLRLRMG
jgi:hypothetical protein